MKWFTIHHDGVEFRGVVLDEWEGNRPLKLDSDSNPIPRPVRSIKLSAPCDDLMDLNIGVGDEVRVDDIESTAMVVGISFSVESSPSDGECRLTIEIEQ